MGESVESASCYLLTLGPYDPGCPGQHGGGSLSGKSQKQDFVRLHSFLDKPGNSVNQSTGLAASGTGYHQNRAVHDFYCPELFRIEFTLKVNKNPFWVWKVG